MCGICPSLPADDFQWSPYSRKQVNDGKAYLPCSLKYLYLLKLLNGKELVIFQHFTPQTDNLVFFGWGGGGDLYQLLKYSIQNEPFQFRFSICRTFMYMFKYPPTIKFQARSLHGMSREMLTENLPWVSIPLADVMLLQFWCSVI